jgi:hypothetical protein
MGRRLEHESPLSGFDLVVGDTVSSVASAKISSTQTGYQPLTMVFSEMKTAQSLGFLIRQLRPATRSTPKRNTLFHHHSRHVALPQHSKLLPAASTSYCLSTPYSTISRTEGSLPTKQTPPGTSFTTNKYLADVAPPSSQGEPAIIERHVTKAFAAKFDIQRPSYQIHFTCRPCGFRSAHEISKHGYHSGSILVTCPECRNRHIICDHLKVCMSFRLFFFGARVLYLRKIFIKRNEITENLLTIAITDVL